MKIRTVKKAIRAFAEGRRTPLMKTVRLDNISYLEYKHKCGKARRESMQADGS